LIKIAPLEGLVKPAIRLRSVDLPQPEGPIIETKVFGAMSKLIFAKVI
jgi:hypothetical protein